MDEKYYGVLMNKVNVDGTMTLYKPQCIIEGIIINEEDEMGDYQLFVDSNNSEYALATSPDSIVDDCVVAYPISGQELMEKFDVDTIDKAKIRFTDWVFSNIHFGSAVLGDDEVETIALSSVSTGEFFDMVFYGREIGNSSSLSIPLDEDAIILKLSDLESLLKIEDFESLRQVIGDIYSVTNKLINESKMEKSSNEICELFENTYDSLIQIDDLSEMKSALNQISEMYLSFMVTLDDEKYNEMALKESIAFLYFFADKYEQMAKKNDLESIKTDLKALIKEKREKIYEIVGEPVEENYELTEIAKETNAETDKMLSVKDIKKYFDETIIGQEEAKKDVIAAIYMNKLGTDASNKNNCLLVGPTGSGKTLIAETVAKCYDMPIEIIDTTQLTVPGYVGANIEDFLERLLDKTRGDLERAENGIVVFDEIDKKGSSNNSDVSGRGVLNTLLPFISGTTYDVTYNRRTYHFDTSKLTILATGAFTNANEEKSYGGSKIGFNSETKKVDIEYKKFNIDDFVRQAEMPAELIGRFSVITQLDGHTKESLKTILTESKKSALLSEKEKLEKIGIELRWTDGYLDKVAEKALELKTGARSLKSTVDKSIKEVRWEVLSNLDIYSGIILTDKTVKDNQDCLLVDNEGNTHSFKDIISSKDETSVVLVKK